MSASEKLKAEIDALVDWAEKHGMMRARSRGVLFSFKEGRELSEQDVRDGYTAARSALEKAIDAEFSDYANWAVSNMKVHAEIEETS